MVEAIQMSDNFEKIYAISQECLHEIVSVQDQTQTILNHWKLIKVRGRDGNFSRHLSGLADGEGRASTDIVSLDILQLRATTKSGRIYLLECPGRDSDADWVFANWLRINRCTLHSDQTNALLRLQSKLKVARITS